MATVIKYSFFFLVWMHLMYKVSCDATDEEEKGIFNGETIKLSPSSLSRSWENENEDPEKLEDEVLVFENAESLDKEKAKFRRIIQQDGSVVHSSYSQVAALQANSPSSNIARNRAQVFYQGYNVPTCGMCSREQNLCQIISGIFTRPNLPYGYSLVTPIPAGVCNVTVVEIKPSKNYFALRQKDGNYVLNGNWDLQAAGSYRIAGTIFHYSPSDGSRGEKLESSGPILEPIDLMIIYQSKNPGIKYEYRIPLPNVQGTRNSFPIVGNTNFPSHGIQRPPNRLPNSRRGGLPQLNQRPSYSSQSSNGNPPFPQTSLDSGNVPPNWNTYNSFLPPRTSGVPSRAQGIPINQRNKVPPTSSQRYHKNLPRTTASETKIYTKSVNSDPRFQNDRFPEILNTEPRTVQRHDDPTAFVESKPLYDHMNSESGAVNHKTRHNHGSRIIQPGPAVGGNRLPPMSADKVSDTPFYISNKNRNRNENKSKEKSRKRKRKGKKRNGRKRKNRFHWVFKGLSECSRSCGGGEQISTFYCERKKKGKLVADKYCHGVPRPVQKSLSCNLKPCPAKWIPGDWSSCSVSCGSGEQTREYKCKQEVSSTLTMVVPEGACFESKTENIYTQECIMNDCPPSVPHWKASEWSECTSDCGIGSRTREVRCHYFETIMDDSMCSDIADKPSHEESCDMGTCVTENTWFFSSWSDKCTDDCQNGVKSRTVVCIQSEFDYVDICPISTRPEPAKQCSDEYKCKRGQWFTGSWSSCSVSCGTGFETRVVQCLTMKGKDWKVANMAICPKNIRPLESRECFQIACRPRWFTSEWQKCSKNCKGGIQWREVKCLNQHLAKSSLCSNETKPQESQQCNEHIQCPHKVKYGESLRDSSESLVSADGKKQKNSTKYNSEKSNTDDDNGGDSMKRYEKISENDEISNELLPMNTDEDSIYDDNQQANELEIDERSEDESNFMPDTNAQGDQSTDEISEIKEENNSIQNEQKEDTRKKKQINPNPSLTNGIIQHSCVDRILNCHLVFRARLCRLRYYNKLCCETCKS